MPFQNIRDDVKLGRERAASSTSSTSTAARSATTRRSAPSSRSRRTPPSGKNCKISSHTFICEGVTIEDDVFVGPQRLVHQRQVPAGHGRGQAADGGRLERGADAGRAGASIGTSCTILANVTIGRNAIIGAGSVVTRDIPDNVVAAGNPCRVLRPLRGRPKWSDLAGPASPHG